MATHIDEKAIPTRWFIFIDIVNRPRWGGCLSQDTRVVDRLTAGLTSHIGTGAAAL